jgi:hypothetical protein
MAAAVGQTASSLVASREYKQMLNLIEFGLRFLIAAGSLAD